MGVCLEGGEVSAKGVAAAFCVVSGINKGALGADSDAVSFLVGSIRIHSGVRVAGVRRYRSLGTRWVWHCQIFDLCSESPHFFAQLIIDGFEFVLVTFDFKQVRFGRFNDGGLVVDSFPQAVNQSLDLPGCDASIAVPSRRGLGV